MFQRGAGSGNEAWEVDVFPYVSFHSPGVRYWCFRFVGGCFADLHVYRSLVDTESRRQLWPKVIRDSDAAHRVHRVGS